MVDTASMLTQLNERVNEQLKAVTCKWLARHHQIPINLAKQLLFAFVEQQGEQVTPTYLLSGIAKDTGAATVQLVAAPDLQRRRAAYTRLDCLHVYGVQPKVAVQDASALWNSDLDQSEALYRTFLSADSTDDESGLQDKAVSAVRCSAVAWTAHPAPRLPLKQIGGTSHAPALAADKGSAPAQSSKGPPSAPAATTAKTGSLWSNNSTKAKPKAASAPAPAKAGKRRLLVDTDDDDDDDEEAVPDKPAAHAKPPSQQETQPAQQKQKEPAKGGAKPSKPPSKGGAASPSKASHGATKEGPTAVPGQQGTGAAGAKKRRKVLKTHINDKGEEETVIEWVEEEAEGEAAGGDGAGAPPQKEAARPAAAPSKPAGKQPKKGAPKQANITAFFGKK